MSESEFSWGGRAFDGDITGRANRMLYILLAIFACSGIGLLAWSISRDYRQTIDTHARQLDVGAMVVEDYLSQALEQTRLLLMDRASQWQQLPASARLGGQAQALLKAGLQGVPNVRSVSLVRADGRVVASSEPANLGLLLPEAPQRGALMWLSQAYPGRDLAEAGKVVISDAPGFVLAAMPLELEGEQWWAVATLSPETFRNYFSRLDLLGEGRLEVYRYDGVPLFAYGSGQWLTTVERQDRFGVQLAAREIGPAAERLRLGEPVLESYRAARRMPVVVVAAENRARVLADWRSNLQMSLWVFLPLLAGLLAATLMMVRQRFSAIRSMEARTQAEVSRLAQLIDSLPDAVVVLGRGGFPLHGNPEWRRFTGEQHDHDSLLSLYRARAGDRPVTESWLAKLSRVLQGSQTHAPPEELSLFDADGQPRVYQLTVQRLTDSADTVVLVQHDLTDSHAHAHKLRYLSSHDALTGLYNRACFNELLAQSLEHALPLAVLFVDLDHFKDINDAQGHQTGDQILIKAARRIQQSVRPTDIVGRYGGDEFVVVLSAPALPALAERVAGRLNQQLSMPFEVDGRSFQISASIGIAHAPAHGRILQDLVAAADAAMYVSKAAGRNRATCYSPPPLPV